MKEKLIKEVVGNRVYLEIPEIPKPSIILSEEAEKKWIEEHRFALNKFKIYAVGNNVTNFTEGEEIALDMVILQRVMGTSPLPLSKDVSVIVVSSMDICHRW